MKIDTKHFGNVDIEENKLIQFKEGLPGFTNLNKFVLLAEPKENDGLFYYLQSVEDPNVAFVMVNMVKYLPDYNPLVEAEEIAGLGNYSPDKFNFYNIAVFKDDIKESTVNLKAPVVINNESKQGKQVICTNEEYDVSHFMFK